MNTELWPEWDEIPKEECSKSDALEKYILPIAKDKYWNDNRKWRSADITIDEDEGFKRFACSFKRLIKSNK